MGEVIRGRVNWELRKQVNQVPADRRLFGGQYRCIEDGCGSERNLFVVAPSWAADPPSPKCEQCGGSMLRVDPEVEDEAEPLTRIVPKDQEHLID